MPKVEPGDRATSISVIHSNDLLSQTLLDAGSAALDAALADMSAGDLQPLAGRPLRLWFGPATSTGARTLVRVEYRNSARRTVILARQGEDFTRQEKVEAADDTPVRLRLSLANAAELPAAAAKAGLPAHVSHQLLELVGQERLTALDLIVAHEQVGAASDYGAPLYLALHLEGGEVRRWLNSGESLRPLRSAHSGSALLRPVPGRVTSSPGMRFHPILRYLRWHRGTDLSAPSGTPVRAALPGRVVEAGWSGGYGRVVRLAHQDGSQTRYAHLSAIGSEVGTTVEQGAIIGSVGASGLATGPHLHFEWLRGNEVLQPAFSKAGDEPSSAPDRQTLARLQALLAAPFRLPQASRT